MTIPLLDLKAQYAGIRDEIDAAVAEIFESQYFILGPKVKACEAAIAEYCGCEHACGVSSGTDALLIALMAEGIGPGDEVITTPYTFFATAGSIVRLGATPVFVDIDPITFNLDVEQAAAKVNDRTRCILPVHLFGQMADMDPIMALAKQHDLIVIEDAAQAIGAEYKGRRAGSIGHYGCFSFFPSKNLGGAGDGGIVTTRDAARAQKLQDLRNHGMRPKYHHELIGGNFRLDALQAAVISVKLPHLDAWNEARRVNAQRYDRLFREAGLAPGGEEYESSKVAGKKVGKEWESEKVANASLRRSAFDVRCSTFPSSHLHTFLPSHSPPLPHPVRAPYPGPSETGHRHVWNQYVIRTRNRDALRSHLTEQGIGNEIYYPAPLHRQPCFAYLGYGEGSLPHSETAAEETLALPIYPQLSDTQAKTVVQVVKSFISS